MNNLSKRSYIVAAVFAVVALIYVIDLFRLQVLDSDYKQYATNNVLREVVQYPARGLIYDRDGELMVYNKTAYDLMITPREVGEFDTLLLCNLLDITVEDLEAGIQKAKKYSRYKPSVLIKQISPENFALLQEKLYKFKGFHSQTRTLREYTHPVAAHVLGYVGEVSANDIKRDVYYKSGDYIGQSGIERTYEEQLRGVKGVKKYMVDVHNRIQGSYLNGREDQPAEIGKNLVSTVDIDLQVYAEELFQNKKGAVVAIEPKTGEILAMLSAPTYDPGLLVGRVRGKNFSHLQNDSLMPLFDRSLQARYPPGSTFKPFNILIGLQEGAINTSTRVVCNGRSSQPIRCTHNHITPTSVVDAVRESCNPFLWNTFRNSINQFPTTAEGFAAWSEYVRRFGIGDKVSEEFYNENPGLRPTVDYYNRKFNGSWWRALTVRSLAIGQGEMGTTPLQMANCAAILANKGYYYPPHIIKEIENDTIRSSVSVKHETGIEAEHFEPVYEGMRQVTIARLNRFVPGISYCGKTGTIQNNQGIDHGAYIAFAPEDDPKIAICVYVEHSKWGASYAAPMASLLIEKYLNDTIATNRLIYEKQMMGAVLTDPNNPDLID
ncbi:penicillin-binding protein 2 [Draconibacterium sp. IB214405]|uniref:penicillin-binding protein 2 n=1 Tax=Draconibacterium sp. IB214405 TaxID=3097352 RepID=UPI002A0D587E|nr:penicillin-binding protein 2 [Draconibacterium sp. IB214405]MDX8340982.1 penicillin-binding protein 2 [Draconibacterium sp. IB214405]